jgi:hypothetical protein
VFPSVIGVGALFFLGGPLARGRAGRAPGGAIEIGLDRGSLGLGEGAGRMVVVTGVVGLPLGQEPVDADTVPWSLLQKTLSGTVA